LASVGNGKGGVGEENNTDIREEGAKAAKRSKDRISIPTAPD